MNKKGFTLIELLIVVAIIGILAAIAIPNLLTALQRAKQKRTMADMRELAIGWEARQIDTGRYNAAAAGYGSINQPVDIAVLEGAIVPTYAKHIATVDGWNTPFQYFTDISWGGAPANQYLITSAGKDGTFDSTITPGPTYNFDCDIVYSAGVFLAYPEGVQQQ
ncbi:MAG TPA: prepilin-type N-terminal cleavage/methylation domain-containing protein [Thermoanaerobaculia bacterium]|nr:prepilin-type N-terminal cleavage/methylation domain-containing protein [Thermoanaerobaculia bacterium]